MKLIQPGIQLAKPKLAILKQIKDKLCITTQEGHHIIRKSDITHLIADSNYTTIYYNGQSILCSQTIAVVHQKIKHPNFVRIHQTYVLNLDYLQKVDCSFTIALLDNGIQLSISRSRKQFLKEMINQHFD